MNITSTCLYIANVLTIERERERDMDVPLRLTTTEGEQEQQFFSPSETFQLTHTLTQQ